MANDGDVSLRYSLIDGIHGFLVKLFFTFISVDDSFSN